MLIFFHSCVLLLFISLFFFFNDTAPTEIYTLSLHDALPISTGVVRTCRRQPREGMHDGVRPGKQLSIGLPGPGDRKSTRLNSSHEWISYAVFCLKKKKRTIYYKTIISLDAHQMREGVLVRND